MDAYALIYRAFYAFIRNPRINSKGLNTSAIYGFTNTLLDLINRHNPSHIAVVFDPPSPTFRHEIFPEYKANRQDTPEDIIKSVPVIKQIIEAFNIPIVEISGFEADDVIGTISKIAEKSGTITYMVTPDKDYSQLVSSLIYIYKPGRAGNDDEILGTDEICSIFNISDPLQVTDILGLMGDKSDNIPGAPGIGEVNAKKLIGEFGTIDVLFNNIDTLKGKIHEIILTYKDQILLSKYLATIKTDVPVNINMDDLLMNEPDYNELKVIFEELEFKSLIERIFKQDNKNKDNKFVQGNLFESPDNDNKITISSSYKNIDLVTHQYVVINQKESIINIIDRFLEFNEFCFDTETTSLDVHSAQIVGLSLCVKSFEAYYIPFPENRKDCLDIIELISPLFKNGKILKIGQNIKFDILILKNYNLYVSGPLYDTMIAHYLIQPELHHNMDYLAEQYLHYTPVPIVSLIGKKGKNQLSMRSVPLEKIKEYCCEDADVTFQLKGILNSEIIRNQLSNLFFNIEMPLVEVLVDIESSGFTIDTECLKHLDQEYKVELANIENEIYQLAGVTFNISSPKQLGDILFEKLRIDTDTKRTKTKQYSTSEETLTDLIDKHPIVNKILDFRSLKKLLTTYIEVLPELINPLTEKVHTSFNQTVTSTGRLSSNNPNLQNIPVREQQGREIRKAFIPSNKDQLLISADYSQIELRLMAHLSEDKNMLEAFQHNEDIHASTASNIYKVDISQVTREMRRNAKTANFGIIYGISSFGLSQRLNISRSEAKNLIDQYFSTYPGVKQYIDKSINFARQHGYVQTILGRKRYLADINSKNNTVRGYAERNAINAPIQGSAADIIKIAMISIFRRLKNEHFKAKMILQVHDELIFDTPKAEIEDIKKLVKEEMEQAVKLKIPIQVEIGIGNNWLEAH